MRNWFFKKTGHSLQGQLQLHMSKVGKGQINTWINKYLHKEGPAESWEGTNSGISLR